MNPLFFICTTCLLIGSNGVLAQSNTNNKVGTFEVKAPDDIIAADVLIPFEGETFLFVEQMPVFPGGERAYQRYIGTMLWPSEDYPSSFRTSRYVQFVIDSNGIVRNVKSVKRKGDDSPFDILDTLVVQHMQKMPQWTLGVQAGRTVNVEYFRPVRFIIN